MAVDPQLPEWNPSESEVVDPPAGKKAAGWQSTPTPERPAAQFVNWYFNRAWQWLVALARTTTGLATWDGSVSALEWFVIGGPGVTFSFRITALNAVKTEGANFGVPASITVAGIPTIEGGATYLEPNAKYYVFAWWDAPNNATKFEASLTPPVGAVKDLDATRRYLFPFYTNRRTVAGTDYGLPIPFVRHGAETRYLLNADTADRGLTIFEDATADETDSEVAIDLSVMLPLDAREVCIRVKAYVSTPSSGGMVHLYSDTGADSDFNAVGFIGADDQYHYTEVWVPLHANQTLFVKLNRTRAATPMTTDLTLYVVGYRSPQP